MTAKRKVSSTGFYHVIMKANGDQLLFTNEEDYLDFLDLLALYKVKDEQAVHAWVLMDNHVHLLIQDKNRRLSRAMYDVASNYAKRFNRRHDRSGVVFRGRFWSEPIEDESHLLAVMEYIHDNPETAGICPADNYRWSSYGVYAGRREDEVTDASLLLGILGGIKAFKAAQAKRRLTARPFPGSRIRRHLSERELAYVVEGFFGKNAQTYLRTLKSTARKDAVRDLIGLGLSVPEISRFTGLSQRRVRVISSKA